MKYEYVIRTYSKDGRNIYAEGEYTLEDAINKFNDVCKTANEVVEIFGNVNKHNYCRVVMVRLSDGVTISEKVYEC